MDKVQIQQVVLNLIRNALEAMQGSDQPSVTIETDLDQDGFVLVSVLDAGPGIPDDVMVRLFQPFVTTKEGGMGIGLSICRSIIESHGGKIWAQANEPRGTKFTIRLPIGEAQ